TIRRWARGYDAARVQELWAGRDVLQCGRGDDGQCDGSGDADHRPEYAGFFREDEPGATYIRLGDGQDTSNGAMIPPNQTQKRRPVINDRSPFLCLDAADQDSGVASAVSSVLKT